MQDVKIYKSFLRILSIAVPLFLGTCTDPASTEQENTPPEITLKGESEMTIYEGSSFEDPGATANDKEDGNLTGDININYGDLDIDDPEPGKYTIVYTVEDKDGDSASVNRKVTVKINNQPTITLLEPLHIILCIGDKFVDPGATAEDEEDGDLTDKIEIDYDGLNPDDPEVGEYELVYSVTDKYGKSAKIIRRVTATDNHRPVITLYGDSTDIILEGEPYDNPGATVEDVEDGSSLNDRIKVSCPGLDTLDPESGEYSMTYSVNDNDGAIDSVSRVIIVIRNDKFIKIKELSSKETVLDCTTVMYKISSSLTIPEDYTLTFGNNIWVVVIENIIVDGKLKINEGVQLRFDQGKSLHIKKGRLTAKGASHNRILFRNYEKGKYWGHDGDSPEESYGIKISEESNFKTILEHCKIDSATTSLLIERDKLTINYTQVSNSKYHGMYFSDCGPEDSVAFTDNIFLYAGSSNEHFPLVINVNYLYRLSGTGEFEGNKTEAILIKKGTAAQSGIWRKFDVPYVLEGKNVINNEDGVEISVLPGVAFKFKKDAYLKIKTGTFKANGTAFNQITFSNYDKGEYWGFDDDGSENSYGILFTEEADNNSYINYCVVDSGTTGINVEKNGITISNITIKNSKYAGMYFSDCGPKDSSGFIKNTFHGNGYSDEYFPLNIAAKYLYRLSGTSTFRKNANQAILVRGDEINNSGTLKKQSVPYLFDSVTVIGSDDEIELTIEPGTEFLFGKGSYITIEKVKFQAVGTEKDSILFSNFTEGEYWGNDGEAGKESYGLDFTDKIIDGSELSYCIFKYATQALRSIDSPVKISDCSVMDSKYHGIYSSGTGNENIKDDEISYSGNGESPDHLHED